MKKYFVLLALVFVSFSLMVSGCGKVAQETSESVSNDQNIEAASLNSNVQIPDDIKKELVSGKVKAIISVTPDKGSIQEAIDKATPGTIIYISEGTYNLNEPLTIQNKENISLVGAGLNSTKIVGDPIENNSIHVNTAKNIKVTNLCVPGIYIKDTDGFTLNTAKLDEYAYITGKNSNNVLVKNCIFEKASVMFMNCKGFKIIKNTFKDDTCFLHIFDYSEGEVKYNLFYNGTSAIHWDNADTVVIQHNTFDSFTAAIDFTRVQSGSGYLITIKDNIFSYMPVTVLGNWDSEPFEYSYNCFWNAGVPTSEYGENYIKADPLYVDRENGNYHLQEGSPCIGAASDGIGNIGAF